MIHLKFHILGVLGLVFLLASHSAFALLEECPETDPNAPSPKKIAIFTDGTANTKDDQTNVYRLYELTTQQARTTPGVVTYYDRGVGNFGTKLSGGAVGLGLSRNVRQAYRCLADHYRPGDQIYLFGFSRGAYTARVLGGLIHFMGVLEFPAGISKKIRWIWLKICTISTSRTVMKSSNSCARGFRPIIGRMIQRLQ